MLRLRFETEDWRECLLAAIDAAEAEFGEESDVSFYDDAADELCSDTLRNLWDAGVEYDRSYQQSKGSCVIIQSGSPEEIEAFETAFEAAMLAAEKTVRRLAKTAADDID